MYHEVYHKPLTTDCILATYIQQDLKRLEDALLALRASKRLTQHRLRHIDFRPLDIVSRALFAWLDAKLLDQAFIDGYYMPIPDQRRKFWGVLKGQENGRLKLEEGLCTDPKVSRNTKNEKLDAFICDLRRLCLSLGIIPHLKYTGFTLDYLRETTEEWECLKEGCPIEYEAPPVNDLSQYPREREVSEEVIKRLMKH